VISGLVFRYSSDQPARWMPPLEPDGNRFRFRFQMVPAASCPGWGRPPAGGGGGWSAGGSRHISTGRARIEIAGHPEPKPTRLADTPGDLTCFVAGAEIEISPGRPDNGGTSVLGNHGAAEWSACVGACNWKVRLDEKWRAIDMQCLVHRNGTAC